MQDLKGLVDMQAVKEFRDRALNPEHPVIRGTTQNPDIYFQQREGANTFYNVLPDIVENHLKEFEMLTGREYKLYDYYGAEDADRIIIAMGSVCDTVDETIDFLTSKGEKIGAIRVHLYRPFAVNKFIDAIPKSVKRIAVLDRTKENGATGEPLYLDVVSALKNNRDISIVGGRYGLSSKDTRPSQILAVFNNLKHLRSGLWMTLPIPRFPKRRISIPHPTAQSAVKSGGWVPTEQSVPIRQQSRLSEIIPSYMCRAIFRTIAKNREVPLYHTSDLVRSRCAHPTLFTARIISPVIILPLFINMIY
jgi:hypothetical protein